METSKYEQEVRPQRPYVISMTYDKADELINVLQEFGFDFAVEQLKEQQKHYLKMVLNNIKI